MRRSGAKEVKEASIFIKPLKGFMKRVKRY